MCSARLKKKQFLKSCLWILFSRFSPIFTHLKSSYANENCFRVGTSSDLLFHLFFCLFFLLVITNLLSLFLFSCWFLTIYKYLFLHSSYINLFFSTRLTIKHNWSVLARILILFLLSVSQVETMLYRFLLFFNTSLLYVHLST